MVFKQNLNDDNYSTFDLKDSLEYSIAMLWCGNGLSWKTLASLVNVIWTDMFLWTFQVQIEKLRNEYSKIEITLVRKFSDVKFYISVIFFFSLLLFFK